MKTLLRSLILIVPLIFGAAIWRTAAQSSVSTQPTVSTVYACGSTVACAKTAQSNAKVLFGTAPLTTGTPSTAIITGLPYTSSSSYGCSAEDATSVATVQITYNSGASMTFTGGSASTDVISYLCVGN